MHASEAGRQLLGNIRTADKHIKLGIMEAMTGTVFAIPDASIIVQDLSNRHPDITTVIGDLVNSGVGPVVALAVGVLFLEDGIRRVIKSHTIMTTSRAKYLDLQIQEAEGQKKIK